MAKKVIWSKKAQEDRITILQYWIKNNQSNTYSIKLFSDFNACVDLIEQYPRLGKATNRPDTRILVIYDYWIIYVIKTNSIIVARIWDVRQNPRKLKY